MQYKHHHKLLGAGIIAAAVFGVGLLSCLILLLINASNTAKNSSGLSDNDIQAISELTKFTDTQTEDYHYQSSLYNFQLEINTKKYTFTEVPNGLTIADKNIDNQVIFDITENTDNVTLASAVSVYKNVNKNLKAFAIVSEHASTLDGTPASEITYTYTNSSNKTIAVTAVVMVTPRFVYEIQYTNFNSAAKDATLFTNLISSFKFINGAVEGATTSESSSETDEKTAALAKPAVFQKCGNLNIPYEQGYPNTTGKTYNLCSAATGSGFFINSKGYVATNGHVVSQDEAFFKQYAGSQRLYINLFKDLIQPILRQYDSATYGSMTDDEIMQYFKDNPTDAQDIVSINSELITQAYTSMDFTETAYVQKGTNAFTIGTDTSNLANTTNHYKATVVDMDYSPTLGANGKETASDVAILKIKDGDYPILHLGSNEFTIPGTQIIAIGFPGAANTLDMIDNSVSSQATFTKGVVSRIVDTTGGRKIIQIDASINHGNSGGPLISAEDGTVLGLNTYGVEAGSSDYNYARDVADLKALMTTNHITNTGSTTQAKLEEGLNFFFDGYYSKAIISLNSAKDSYPDIEGLDTVIALAQDKVTKGLDKVDTPPPSNDIFTTITNMSSTEKVLSVVVVCLLCLVLFIVFGMLFLFKRLKKPAQPEAAMAVDKSDISKLEKKA